MTPRAGPVNEKRVVLGRIAGLFGVKGWVKVLSYTEPRANIAGYLHWQLELETGPRSVQVEVCQTQGKRIVAKLAGIEDRDAAAALVGADISVSRAALPAPEADSYYWADLEQLAVETTQGVALGRVHRLLATGAHDVLVVHGDRERLIPFVRDKTVKHVDLRRGVITVDWDPNF